MKVLVFATQHLQTGGIESHLQEFCENMSAAGVQIDLVVLNSGMLPETEAFFRKVCNKVYLGKHGRSYKRLTWLLKTGLWLRWNKFDALYTNGQGSSAGMFARMLRYRNWVHHHHTAGDAVDQSYWGAAYIKTLKKADTLIACAQRNAGGMQAVLNRKVDVVYCFSRKVILHDHEPMPSGKLRFGYFGRLIPEKGIDLICRLSTEEQLSHIAFNLWGEGPKYAAGYFDKFPGINYRGTYKGKKGLSKAIGMLDAFLLLSTHSEGLPISLLEVMSAGLPWLATDRGGIQDIACDPVSTRVLTSTPDYDTIKAEVISLANDIMANKISRSKQMQLYDRNFSAGALVKQWHNVLFTKNV